MILFCKFKGKLLQCAASTIGFWILLVILVIYTHKRRRRFIFFKRADWIIGDSTLRCWSCSLVCYHCRSIWSFFLVFVFERIVGGTFLETVSGAFSRIDLIQIVDSAPFPPPFSPLPKLYIPHPLSLSLSIRLWWGVL